MASLDSIGAGEIGYALSGFGLTLTVLGLFFFEKKLLAIGNILFFIGVALTIGVVCTLKLFLKRQNLKGSVAFAIGFILVSIGWPITGIILESYGFLVILSSWPRLLIYLRKLPAVGSIFWHPSVVSFFQHYKVKGPRVPV